MQWHALANAWRIVSVDPAVVLSLSSDGQTADGSQLSQTPALGVSPSPGATAPSVQWVASGPRSLAFAAQIKSRDFGHDIRPDLQALERLRTADQILGRAPRVLAVHGGVQVTGFVSRLELHVVGFWATGLPRRVDFSIEVVEAAERSYETVPVGETAYRELVDGETFEQLGLEAYRDPLKGELIRRENPEIAGRFEVAGDVVKVLEREHPRTRGRVVPVSAPLQAGWEDVVMALGASRGTSAEPGMAFDDLPDVLAGLVAW